jgi:hypothetical protein
MGSKYSSNIVPHGTYYNLVMVLFFMNILFVGKCGNVNNFAKHDITKVRFFIVVTIFKIGLFRFTTT